MIYLAIGQPKRCAEICQEGLKANPNDADLRPPLAQAYLAMGKRDDCIREWKQVIASRPQSLPAYQRLVSLLLIEAGLEEEGTTRPAQAFVRMSIEDIEKALTKARGDMAAIPRARQDLVDFAVAGLYARLGQPLRGAEYCERAIRNPTAGQTTQYRARLLRASLLARAGKLDDALGQLDELIAATQGIAKTRAMYGKANLLSAAKRFKEAEAVLATLCEEAQARKDPLSLLQAAGLLARIEEVDKALSTCDAVQQLLPDDPRSYLLRADVLISARRIEEVPDLYEKAIELQPGDFRLYRALSQVLDAQGRPRAALKALDRLQSQDQAGKPIGLFYQGALLAGWGLQAEAAGRYEEVAKLRYGPSPDLQLALASAFARLGRSDQARAALARIPEHAREYIPAQLMLSDMAETAEAKLAPVRELARKRPRSELVLLQEMSILVRAGKPGEAVKAFEDFRARVGAAAMPPERGAALALTAAIRAGDLSKARQISKALAEASPAPRWRTTAAMMLLDDDPAAAERMLPEPSKAGVFPAALSLCVARRSGDEKTVKQCADRLDKLDVELGRLQPPRSIPAAARLLCALLARDELQVKVAVAKLGSGPIGAAAHELVSHSNVSPKAASEIMALLKALIARELGLPEVARIWAVEALKARPTSQWAALEIWLTGPGITQLQEASETLRPQDCELAQVLRAELLSRQKQSKQAAEIYGALARRGSKVEPEYLQRQAVALEEAGSRDQALAIYRELLQSTKDPLAANNAACLVMQLSPKDSTKLAEARQWVDAALKARPLPHIQDTAGWIAHLQGRDADALPLLRRAVKGLPDSPDIHCHLGLVEAAAGDRQLAAWHLDAAVHLGDRLKSTGQAVPETTAEAIRLAREALAKLKQSG
jgi:tetratricopeptide (TPR) repeat protein